MRRTIIRRTPYRNKGSASLVCVLLTEPFLSCSDTGRSWGMVRMTLKISRRFWAFWERL